MYSLSLISGLLAQSLVCQSLVTAISQVRFENGKTPSVVRQFFIDQLRYNDNTSNPVSLPYQNWQNLTSFV